MKLVLYDGFMNAFLGKKLLLLGFVIVLLVVIPLTVYLVQQQQKTQIGAAKSTVLSLKPATLQTNVGRTENFDVEVNPGSNQNQISFVKFVITYDTAKFDATSSALTINRNAFPTTLQGPTLTAGNVSVTLSVGPDPNKVISSITNVATLSLKALSKTATGSPTRIVIDQNQSQVLSVATSDQFSEDVLLAANSATVTILEAGASGTGGTPGPAAANQVPVCSSLNVDRSTSGTAPYPITFTVAGNDPDGTISKVTFNFGDGPQVDETTGGGIGTKTVSLAKAHTYQNNGTFTATAVLTDNQGGVSSVGSCTKSITLTAASGTGTGTGTGVGTTITVSPTPSGIPSATIAPTPLVGGPTPPPTSLPPVGPSDLLAKVGGVAVLFTILGVLLLFAP